MGSRPTEPVPEVLHTSWCKEHWLLNLTLQTQVDEQRLEVAFLQWEYGVARYEKDHTSAQPDSVKIAIMLNETTGALQEHPQLRAGSITRYSEIRNIVVQYNRANWTIGNYNTGKNKGKGKSKAKGKGNGYKGKGYGSYKGKGKGNKGDYKGKGKGKPNPHRKRQRIYIQATDQEMYATNVADLDTTLEIAVPKYTTPAKQMTTAMSKEMIGGMAATMNDGRPRIPTTVTTALDHPTTTHGWHYPQHSQLPTQQPSHSNQ